MVTAVATVISALAALGALWFAWKAVERLAGSEQKIENGGS
jgi:threonine/homoserine/homoserine lactone efflux protein